MVRLFTKMLLAFVLVTLSFRSFSQNGSMINNDPGLITNTHYYKFQGNENTSVELINQMQEEVQKLKFVVNVVTKFSEQKKSGYLKVITQHKPVKHESDEQFTPKSLKEILTRYNIEPLEYSVNPDNN